MSGQRKKRDQQSPEGEPFVPARPPAVITAPEEQKPPAPARVIIYCKDCFWGTDVSIGQRRCRGTTPLPFYKQVTGYNGDIMATPMWAVVRDLDWCKAAEPK